MTTTTPSGYQLDDRYAVEDGLVYLSGVQALVRLPLDIRRHDLREGRDTSVFISGYEGSKPRRVLVDESALPQLSDAI